MFMELLDANDENTRYASLTDKTVSGKLYTKLYLHLKHFSDFP